MMTNSTITQEAIDRLVRRVNAAGFIVSRETVESCAAAFKRMAVGIASVGVAMRGAIEVYRYACIRMKHSPRFAQRLISSRRFKTRRLRKKYGQEL